MKLTQEQLKWLDSRGGRNDDDVLIDSGGLLYVMMGNGRGRFKRVYLPE